MTYEEALDFLRSTDERWQSWNDWPDNGSMGALIACAVQRQREEEHSASAQSSTTRELDPVETLAFALLTGRVGWPIWRNAENQPSPAWQPELPKSALIPDGWPNATPPRDASEIRDWLRTGKRELTPAVVVAPVSKALPPFAGFARICQPVGALATWEARK